ncbi:MAG: Gfo/Idh/MocA family oxidoreductase, partial [Planctomycetota bacterium]
MLPVGVIGCGRMGRLHARVYGEMPDVELVSVCDADEANARRVAETYGGRHTTSVEELAERVQAVTIAVPTVHHLDVATPLLERGIACLIEKPLAPDVVTARKIAELAEKHDAVVQVGHIERFNPVVRSLRALQITPRFIEVTRVSPMTFRSIDVGVVLDMMIHDIDIVTWLAGSTVEAVEAVGVPVLVSGVEDVCNARIRYANGCVANLTASRM